MKVLYQNRDPNKWGGGDLLKMFNFKEHLEDLGIEVGFDHDPKADLSGYDLVHLHNLNFDWTYKQFTNALSQFVPVVVSSIFHEALAEKRNNKARAVASGCNGLVCFTPDELISIEVHLAKFNDFADKTVYINNGVADYFYTDKLSGRSIDVLAVGSIEPRKNQLGLVKACKFLGYNLTIVGRRKPNHEDYYRKCCDAGPFTHVPHVSQDRVADFYKRARVLAQPSMDDPYPNTVLEGGLAGCNIVLTNHTFAPRDLPNTWWCSPDRTWSIVSSLHRAYNAPLSSDLQEYVKKKHNWEKQADRMVTFYEEIINEHKHKN